MGELLGVLAGVIGATLTYVLKEAFFKGKNSQRMKALEESVEKLATGHEDLKELVLEMKSSLQLQQQALETMEHDHMKIDKSISALNENLSQNNQAISSLDATMQGLQNLIQNILDGNLKINPR